MSDVFVSYKAEDRARVLPLVQALEADGLSVWWDAHVGGGEEWRDSIARHLDEAKCVIVIWSKRSIGPDGHFVRDEATRALRRHAYLPVRIDKVEPPLGFGETQAIPLAGWKGNRRDPRYLAVLSGAQSMLGLEPVSRVSSVGWGIDRRMLVGGGATVAAVTAAGGWFLLKPAKGRANSIAVLPFANLSGDPAQAYFSDGIAEELRNALSRAGLTVVARTSSEMVRNADAKTAARQLDVAHIVSGSVRRSPSMIRVNAQLVDGGDGLERWSDSFDRPAGDLLAIQTSIAENVAQALSVELAGDDRNVVTLGGTGNPAAQDLYLRTTPGGPGDSEAGLNQYLGLLNAAIALDPNFAQAHARKAFILTLIAGIYALSAAEAQAGYQQALASANRAIAIAPRLATAHATRGSIFRDRLDLGRALAEMERADALPGDDAHALRVYAFLLGQVDRPDQALRTIERARQLDPLNPISLETEATVLMLARRYADSAESARQALQLSPDREQSKRVLGNALMMLGRPAEAEAVFQTLDANDYRRLVGEAVMAARTGKRDEALSKLRTMERRYGDAAHYQYAEIYAQLGQADQAFEQLELAWTARDPGLAGARVDPFLDPLRGDPRFSAIEGRLNFPRR